MGNFLSSSHRLREDHLPDGAPAMNTSPLTTTSAPSAALLSSATALIPTIANDTVLSSTPAPNSTALPTSHESPRTLSPPASSPVPTAATKAKSTTASPPSLSNSLSTPHSNYDVFISHACEDKGTIAIPLREKLMKHGITAFVDDADMPVGTRAINTMESAMERARIGVIVLSPEFVSRKWPIRELMCFLGRLEKNVASDHAVPVIVPFFYRLKVDELYDEPNFDRLDKDGNRLYGNKKSRFFERMKNDEPEANIKILQETLRKLHGIMGVRNDIDATNDSEFIMYRRREILLNELCEKIRQTMGTGPLTIDGNMEGRSGTNNVFLAYCDTKLDTSDLIFDFSNENCCRRNSSSTRSFEEHLNVCSRLTEKPYACDRCGKAFKKNSNLVKHVKLVHLGEKKFACTEPGCGRLFGQKSNWKNHFRAVHLGENPFACTEGKCSKRFSQKSGLKAHIKTVHNGECPYECECGSSFGHCGDKHKKYSSMARTRPYLKKTMTLRTRYGNPAFPASSPSSDSSNHATTSPPPQPQPSTPDPSRGRRRRRGHQARPSHLTPAMHRAVRRFAQVVGGPNIVEPTGFRDFRGWLAHLGARESRPIWDELIATVARDVGCDIEAVNALKEDVVREIVKCVVLLRPDESAKLVSANAERQASRPRSGTTLMIVLENQLERVLYRLPELVAELPPPSTGSDEGIDAFFGGYQDNRFPIKQKSNLGQSVDKLPSVSHILRPRHDSSSRQPLPSFRELDDSLRRSGSGSGSGSR